MDKDIITLMMVTYNRLDLTKQTLQSIKDTVSVNYNLVIIDNGSTDGTKEYLTENYPGAILVFNDENKGIAVARNQAMKIAVDLKTDWFCTIDNDVILPNRWLSDCIDILSVNKSFGMIGVNMEGVKYPLISCGGVSFQEKPRGNLGTACIVFPSSLQKMLGYFNTEYGLYGEEDADYGMRARVLGYRLGYIKEMGEHIGVGEFDQGEYREFKDKSHSNNLKKFNENCVSYANRKKSLFIPYKA